MTFFFHFVDEIPRTSDASGADNHDVAVHFKPDTTLSNVSQNILLLSILSCLALLCFYLPLIKSVCFLLYNVLILLPL